MYPRNVASGWHSEARVRSEAVGGVGWVEVLHEQWVCRVEVELVIPEVGGGGSFQMVHYTLHVV